MNNLAHLTWEDENGPHIHFYDDNTSPEQLLALLMELGLVMEVEES